MLSKEGDNKMAEEFKDLMFPEGKPEPDEFIIALTELTKQIREFRSNQNEL